MYNSAGLKLNMNPPSKFQAVCVSMIWQEAQKVDLVTALAYNADVGEINGLNMQGGDPYLAKLVPVTPITTVFGRHMTYLYLLWFINQLTTWGAPPCANHNTEELFHPSMNQQHRITVSSMASRMRVLVFMKPVVSKPMPFFEISRNYPKKSSHGNLSHYSPTVCFFFWKD